MEAITPPSPPPLTRDQQERLRDSYDLMHKTVLKSMNAYAIVLSILLAASYTGFSQSPKPVFDTQKSSNWLKSFNYFNGFSFYSSVTGLLFYASSSFSPLLALDTSELLKMVKEPGKEAEKEMNTKLKLLAHILPKFLYVIVFFGISLSSFVLAFVFAGLSAYPHRIFEQLPVILTASIGGLVYIQALCIFCSDTYLLITLFMRENQQLWKAMEGSVFGKILVSYVDLLCHHLKVSGDANPSVNNGTAHAQEAAAMSVAP